MSTQYMFGPSLCIGIFTDEIYLPEGKWFDGWTGECVKSTGKFFRIPYPEDRAGVMMIRGGAIVPMMDPVPFIGRKPLDKLTLHIYPDGESRYIMYDCDAESYGYEQGRYCLTKLHWLQETGRFTAESGEETCQMSGFRGKYEVHEVKLVHKVKQ